MHLDAWTFRYNENGQWAVLSASSEQRGRKKCIHVCVLTRVAVENRSVTIMPKGIRMHWVTTTSVPLLLALTLWCIMGQSAGFLPLASNGYSRWGDPVLSWGENKSLCYGWMYLFAQVCAELKSFFFCRFLNCNESLFSNTMKEKYNPKSRQPYNQGPTHTRSSFLELFTWRFRSMSAFLKKGLSTSAYLELSEVHFRPRPGG